MSFRDIEKINLIKNANPYLLLKDTNILWTIHLYSILSGKYPDIFNYLVLTKSANTLSEFKAYKSLDTYNFFVNGWISSAKWYVINKKMHAITEVSFYCLVIFLFNYCVLYIIFCLCS